MYKEDLALNNLQWFIWHETKPNQSICRFLLVFEIRMQIIKSCKCFIYLFICCVSVVFVYLFVLHIFAYIYAPCTSTRC